MTISANLNAVHAQLNTVITDLERALEACQRSHESESRRERRDRQTRRPAGGYSGTPPWVNPFLVDTTGDYSPS